MEKFTLQKYLHAFSRLPWFLDSSVSVCEGAIASLALTPTEWRRATMSAIVCAFMCTSSIRLVSKVWLLGSEVKAPQNACMVYDYLKVLDDSTDRRRIGKKLLISICSGNHYENVSFCDQSYASAICRLLCSAFHSLRTRRMITNHFRFN